MLWIEYLKGGDTTTTTTVGLCGKAGDCAGALMYEVDVQRNAVVPLFWQSNN